MIYVDRSTIMYHLKDSTRNLPLRFCQNGFWNSREKNSNIGPRVDFTLKYLKQYTVWALRASMPEQYDTQFDGRQPLTEDDL